MQVVHVLNGAFMDQMLDPAVPGMIDIAAGTAMLFGRGDEPFDLTTVDDTARFTAYLATDPADVSGVRYISGSRSTFAEIFAETEQLSGKQLTKNAVASAEDLRHMTAAQRTRGRWCRSGTCSPCSPPRPFPRETTTTTPAHPATTLHDYLTAVHAALAPA